MRGHVPRMRCKVWSEHTRPTAMRAAGSRRSRHARRQRTCEGHPPRHRTIRRRTRRARTIPHHASTPRRTVLQRRAGRAQGQPARTLMPAPAATTVAVARATSTVSVPARLGDHWITFRSMHTCQAAQQRRVRCSRSSSAAHAGNGAGGRCPPATPAPVPARSRLPTEVRNLSNFFSSPRSSASRLRKTCSAEPR